MSDYCERPGDEFGYYHNLGPASPELVEGLPPPATGQFVEMETPGDDNGVESYLGLLWDLPDGRRTVDWTDGLVTSFDDPERATWLPRGWRSHIMPIGFSLAHLERWFDVTFAAVERYRLSRRLYGRPCPPKLEWPSHWISDVLKAQTPRDWVADAHLLVRHLRLPDAPREPRTPMNIAGCEAELRDVLAFLRTALAPEVGSGTGVGADRPKALGADPPEDPDAEGAGMGTGVGDVEPTKPDADPPKDPDADPPKDPGAEGDGSVTGVGDAEPMNPGADRLKTAERSGPVAGRWLWWRGKRYDIPGGVFYCLLRFMWNRDSAEFTALEDRDEELDGRVFEGTPAPGTIRARASEVSCWLVKHHIPWRLQVNSRNRFLTWQKCNRDGAIDSGSTPTRKRGGSTPARKHGPI
jgi:hypothetical protein